MKRLIKIAGLVILFGLLMFLGVQLLFTQETKPIRPTRPPRTQDTTKTPESVQKETYVSKVILSVPWGEKNLVYDKEESKPGEFGYYVSEEVELGPNLFAVARSGEIYIYDPLNRRVQRFSADGKFLSVIPDVSVLPEGIQLGEDLCADQEGNIYFAIRSGKKEPLVKKYDQSGKQLKTYYSFEGLRTGGGDVKVYCDSKDRLFMVAGGGLFQIGTKDAELLSALQKSTFKKGGFLGSNSCALDNDQFFRSHSGKFYLVDFNEDTVKAITIPNLTGSVIGFDGNLNIYTHKYDLGKRINLARKYNPKGVLISTIQYYPKHFVSPGVDCQGNLYIFTWFPDRGVEVTKWYKQL